MAYALRSNSGGVVDVRSRLLTCDAMCAQVQLITLLTSWGTKDGGSMGEMFEVHLNSAANARFHALVTTVGAPKGACPGPHTPHALPS